MLFNAKIKLIITNISKNNNNFNTYLINASNNNTFNVHI